LSPEDKREMNNFERARNIPCDHPTEQAIYVKSKMTPVISRDTGAMNKELRIFLPLDCSLVNILSKGLGHLNRNPPIHQGYRSGYTRGEALGSHFVSSAGPSKGCLSEKIRKQDGGAHDFTPSMPPL